MQLSSTVVDSGVKERKLYLGIENFTATHVNPTKAELTAMGMTVQDEPEYVQKVKRDFGDGEKEYDAVNIRIFLTNNDPTNLIRTQVSYQIVRTTHLSSTNKFKVINKYGGSTWIEESHLTAGTLPSNMQWYVNEGTKKALRGEDNLVAFIKAYRNLPNISLQSTADVKSKGIAQFDDTDWDKMFKGDFTDIRAAILGAGTDGKVGFLLGIKHLEDKNVQTLYKQSPLKRYIKKTGKADYLISEVENAQNNGAYTDVSFDLSNVALKEWVAADMIEADSEEDIFATADNFGEEDDLPF